MHDLAKFRRYAKKVKIFQGLEPEEVAFILHCGQELYFRANTTIFHEGMLGTNLFVVLSGKVAIYHKNEFIATCHVGDAFGEMAVLNRKPRTATATAITECRVFTLEEKRMNEILDKHVAVRLLLNIIHVISERLEGANKENTRLHKLLKQAGIS
ncbi:MAG: cyclic nucleotide-binding domain-containing protein [Candidatus Hydrogenedentota bacterium]